MTPEEMTRREAVMTRLQMFIDAKNMSRREFELTTRIGLNYLCGVTVISKSKLGLVGKRFPELNIDWVLTGDGTMLYNDVEFQPQDNQYQLLLKHNRRLLEQVKELTVEINKLNELLYANTNMK